MESILEGRQENRYPFFKPIQITWTDGGQCHTTGTTMNVSLYGLLVEVPKPIPLHSELTVTLQGTELSSKARARHCQEAWACFRVGLRFERTLLAEHIPCLDGALIHSLRCANANSEQTRVPRSSSWRERLHGIARIMHLEAMPHSLRA
jgi:hypothetical protein